MTFTSSQVTVTTTAVRLDTGSAPRGLLIRAVADVFVGGAGVTAATGVKIKAGEDFAENNIAGADGLYAVTAAGTALCYVLQKI